MSNNHTTREGWLMAAADALVPLFKGAGYAIPQNIRYAIAFPSTGMKGQRLGECWQPSSSGDAHYTIIIRADIEHAETVLDILTHEIVHAAVPSGSGHGKVFKKCALAVGLEGKMTATVAGDQLRSTLAHIAAELGPLPHSKLNFAGAAEDKPKKQGTRMLKAMCDCGYTIRLTRMWADLGLPICPLEGHGAMVCEAA